MEACPFKRQFDFGLTLGENGVSIRLLPLLDVQFTQSFGQVSGMRIHSDLLFNLQDFAFLADDERHAFGEPTILIVDAVLFRSLACGVAQDNVIQLQFFRKSGIRFYVIATGGEVRDVVFPQVGAILTERLAFSRSATCESFGIPGHDDRLLATKVTEFVGLTIGALELKFRSQVTCLRNLRTGTELR